MSGGISAEMRLLVLARDKVCQMCGHGRTDPDPYDRRRNVRIGVERRHPGSAENPDNLWVICNNCSEGRRALRHVAPPSRIELMTHIRRATVDDQRHALEWLRQKFGEA